jgi:uncharacterized protein (DUF1778 family)
MLIPEDLMAIPRRKSQRQSEQSGKDTQFNIRMAPAHNEGIERAARVAGQTLTEFTESAVLERAEQILTRHEHILLSDRDFDLFVRIMTADSKPTRTAIREASEFSKGRIEGSRYHW